MEKTFFSKRIIPPQSTEQLGVVCTALGCEVIEKTNYSKKISQTSILRDSPFSGSYQKCSDWILSYIVRGQGKIQMNNEKPLKFQQGMLILLPPSIPFQFFLDFTKSTCIYYISFSGQSLKEHKVCTAIDELYPSINIGLQIEVLEIFQHLLNIGKSSNEDVQREMGATIVLLVAKLVNIYHNYKQIAINLSIVDKAKAIMMIHIRDQITITQIARELHTPLSTFRRIFRSQVGISPYQYFLKQKIKATQQELAYSDLPLRVIAEKYGFLDQYHFSRIFKQVSGVRPAAWRTNKQKTFL